MFKLLTGHARFCPAQGSASGIKKLARFRADRSLEERCGCWFETAVINRQERRVTLFLWFIYHRLQVDLIFHFQRSCTIGHLERSTLFRLYSFFG